MTKQEIKNWIVYEGGILKVDDNHFGGDPTANPALDLRIQQRPGELADCVQFLQMMKSQGESMDYYAEIGACAGGTTHVMNRFLQFKELLIIDDGGKEFEWYVTERKDQLRGVNLGFTHRIEIIGSSAEERVINHAHNISKIHKYDILFIDGDHSYEGVKSDTINYLDIVREGGYILFHDTAHSDGVKRWVSEILDAIPNLEFVQIFAESDEYTEHYINGIGLSLYKKK